MEVDKCSVMQNATLPCVLLLMRHWEICIMLMLAVRCFLDILTGSFIELKVEILKINQFLYQTMSGNLLSYRFSTITMALSTITCNGMYEEFTPKGETLQKVNHKNVTLSLGRNEFRDIVLCINFPNKREMKYTVRDIQIHKTFAKDGKATIKLPTENAQVMISNCAPDQLIMFLKTMSTKLECLRKQGFVSDRLKWKSDLPRTFEEISPLTMRDLKEANELKGSIVIQLIYFMLAGGLKRNQLIKPDNYPHTF